MNCGNSNEESATKAKTEYIRRSTEAYCRGDIIIKKESTKSNIPNANIKLEHKRNDIAASHIERAGSQRTRRSNIFIPLRINEANRTNNRETKLKA